MATLCVDISADKNLSNSSPLAMFAWVICYIITSVIMKPDFLYLIIIIIEMVICQILFQFSPRLVFLTLQFLNTHNNMTPNFTDLKYYPNERDINGLENVLLPEEEVSDE
jgi:hypothetical protein